MSATPTWSLVFRLFTQGNLLWHLGARCCPTLFQTISLLLAGLFAYDVAGNVYFREARIMVQRLLRDLKTGSDTKL